MKKVPPSERLSKEIEETLSGSSTERGDLLELLIEKSVRMVIQRIVEQEVTDYLGRGCFERNSESWRGYRNGYEPKSLKTAEGKLHLEVPQVRGSEQTYRSDFLKNLDDLSPGLRCLAVEMYARGLSTRDIEETLRDRETGKLLLSKDAVSELTEEPWERSLGIRCSVPLC
jgi:putative transposase